MMNKALGSESAKKTLSNTVLQVKVNGVIT